jgi:hypothetical protein
MSDNISEHSYDTIINKCNKKNTYSESISDSTSESIGELLSEDYTTKSVTENSTIKPVLECPTVKSVLDCPTVKSMSENPTINSLLDCPTINSLSEKSVSEKSTIKSVLEFPSVKSISLSDSSYLTNISDISLDTYKKSKNYTPISSINFFNNNVPQVNKNSNNNNNNNNNVPQVNKNSNNNNNNNVPQVNKNSNNKNNNNVPQVNNDNDIEIVIDKSKQVVDSKYILNNKIIIDVAVLCQEYTGIDVTCKDNIINLDEIEVTKEIFQSIFYPYCDNFGINKDFINNNQQILQYISIHPDFRSFNKKRFFLLEELIANIERDLNISRNCFTKESIIELTSEISSIKTLCDINCCSVLSSLSWLNILEIIDNYKLIKTCLCNYDCQCSKYNAIPVCVVNIIFKTPTAGVKNTIIRLHYKITNLL